MTGVVVQVRAREDDQLQLAEQVRAREDEHVALVGALELAHGLGYDIERGFWPPKQRRRLGMVPSFRMHRRLKLPVEICATRPLLFALPPVVPHPHPKSACHTISWL